MRDLHALGPQLVAQAQPQARRDHRVGHEKSAVFAQARQPVADGRQPLVGAAAAFAFLQHGKLLGVAHLADKAAFGQALALGYGLSEDAGSVHLTRLGEQRPDTGAGYAVAEAGVQVTDPATGQPLPLGERGELWIRGRGLMPGYFRDPEATAQVMQPGGWYASGDLGYQDADGALYVVGRLKEMIIRSGFNVYPAEVETALNTHPSVQRSAVVGRTVEDGNEEIVAFVELRPGAALDADAVQAHLRDLLAPYKRPSHIVALTELPTNTNGKVLKRTLRDQALTLTT